MASEISILGIESVSAVKTPYLGLTARPIKRG